MNELDSDNLDLFSKYELGMRRYSTRNAEAIECQHKDTGEKGLVWLLRSALQDAKAEQLFKSRLENLLSLSLAIPEVRTFGVANGNCYLLMGYLGGTRLSSFDGAIAERIRIYREALNIIAIAHANGVYFSDLCDDSFVIRPKGDLSLISILGPFEGKNPNEAPPSSVFYFLSPEQRNGMAPGIPSDVFAMGILGYKLFTGIYPVSKPQSHPLGPKDDLLAGAAPPTGINSELPEWLDMFLGRALGLRYADRFETAEEMLAAYDLGMASGELKLESRWSSSALTIRGDTTGVSISSGNKPEVKKKTANEKPSETKGPKVETFSNISQKSSKKEGKTPKYLIFACAGLMIGAVAAGVIFSGRKTSATKKITLEYVELLPPELQEAVKVILENSPQTNLKINAISQLRDSDNPASFSVLSSLAKFPDAKPVREEIISALASKLKDLGLSRSGELIREWSLRVKSEGKDPADYASFSNFLRACDLTMPLASRRDAIHRTSIEDRTSALQLAGALSLDDPDSDHFLPVLRQLVISDQMAKLSGNGNLSEEEYKTIAELGLGALMAQNKVLGSYFEKDLLSLLNSVSDKDLISMIRSFVLAESNLLYDAANEALRRGAITGLSAIPMKALVDADRMTLSKPTKLALINISTGIYNTADVGKISAWTSIQFEPVLLVVCALSKDREVALGAFEVLASRNIDLEPVRSLMKWFRNPMIWKNRRDLVMPLGVLGLYKASTDAELSSSLDLLMPYASSGKLFEIFIELGEPRLIRMMLDRVAPISSSDVLLALTKHSDKGIRMSAVRALQGRNEVRVLQDLVRGYETEKDPEVRDVYRENHWVVKNRE